MIPASFEYARATSLRDALNVLAKGDGTGTTAFAKTLKEHQANIKKYAKP